MKPTLANISCKALFIMEGERKSPCMIISKTLNIRVNRNIQLVLRCYHDADNQEKISEKKLLK